MEQEERREVGPQLRESFFFFFHFSFSLKAKGGGGIAALSPFFLPPKIQFIYTAERTHYSAIIFRERGESLRNWGGGVGEREGRQGRKKGCPPPRLSSLLFFFLHIIIIIIIIFRSCLS